MYDYLNSLKEPCLCSDNWVVGSRKCWFNLESCRLNVSSLTYFIADKCRQLPFHLA